ncbi:MAG: DUF3048 domain-containing protein [Candidatus Levybacteria bacterium]|nr:DUF3048 domain-containing protein [Candidatus Levybacteria bacterium]
MDKIKLIRIAFVAMVFLVSTGLSYLFFSKSGIASNLASPLTPQVKIVGDKIAFDQTLPKTQPCPLNGALYSKQQESWWKKHAPLGVMIENHEKARPQSGLSFSDIVYEAIAEGGITRFLAIYYCQDASEVGPIRSARTYFLDFISEYGQYPLYAHVGGANQPGPADALSQINSYGWGAYNDMNQFSIGFPTFWRDYDRLGHPAQTEHTMYSTTDKLWEFAKTRGITDSNDIEGDKWDIDFEQYSFKDDAPLAKRPASQTLHIEPWEGHKEYATDWVYDRTTNLYKRNNGSPQIDRNTNKQLTSKNIVLLSMVETSANDGYEDNAHLLYRTKGTGKATIFMDGVKTTGTWRKDSRTARTLIFDASGAPIKFDRGTIWFHILPTDAVVTVK